MSDVRQSALRAREASYSLRACSAEVRNAALEGCMRRLRQRSADIFAANARDVSDAKAAGIDENVLKRLVFDEGKLSTICEGLKELISLDDPLGRVQYAMEMDKGLEVRRISTPIGVLGIIFEARPDALVQIGSLCLKSANCVLMKGGSEAARTNRVLYMALRDASVEAGLPEGWLTLLESRTEIAEMIKLDDCVDMIIPRGSNEFVRYIMDNSRIPVMGHAKGLCHIYLDEYDTEAALRVIMDSKTQYVSVCNALESLLVREDIAPQFLKALYESCLEAHVELRGDAKTREYIPCSIATQEDWDTEYLSYILSVKVVRDIHEAIEHINRHSSHHTDCILTNNASHAEEFVQEVDSADVFVNASTRFADGYCMGMGAEVGVATGRVHARGPVGMEGLLIYKYVLTGHGDIKADYAEGRKHFTHRRLTE